MPLAVGRLEEDCSCQHLANLSWAMAKLRIVDMVLLHSVRIRPCLSHWGVRRFSGGGEILGHVRADESAGRDEPLLVVGQISVISR